MNSDCGVGGAVNDDAVESENVGDGVRGLDGGDGSAGLCTVFVIGSKSRTRLPWSIDSSSLWDRGVCGGGGNGRRGKKGGNPRRPSLIYRYGSACTADVSRDGCDVQG